MKAICYYGIIFVLIARHCPHFLRKVSLVSHFYPSTKYYWQAHPGVCVKNEVLIVWECFDNRSVNTVSATEMRREGTFCLYTVYYICEHFIHRITSVPSSYKTKTPKHRPLIPRMAGLRVITAMSVAGRHSVCLLLDTSDGALLTSPLQQRRHRGPTLRHTPRTLSL